MRYYSVVISKDAPSVKDALWAQPVSGGFVLYLLDAGVWQPLKVVDDNDTAVLSDDSTVNVKNKADKVSSAVNGNLAALNSKGNLTDSGKKASDFEPAGSVAAAVIGLAGGITYKGVVNSDSDLPTNLTSADNGAQYVVGTAGTYQTESLAAGDYLLWNGSSSQWDIVKK